MINDDEYLLVSDSNESVKQKDSKKLSQATLVEMAQDSLFNKHLGIMRKYLTINQYNTQADIIKVKLEMCQSLFNVLDGMEWSKKFTVVDGQVILVEVGEFERYNEWRQENLGSKLTPLEYLQQNWNITSDFWVEQVKDCSFRGMTEVTSSTVERASNSSVTLTEENMPPHMHHSGITKNANVESMGESKLTSDRTGFMPKRTKYDVFYNDSFSTGVDKNEMDGVVDGFNVLGTGENIAENGAPKAMAHDNLPANHKFYAFIIHKNLG